MKRIVSLVILALFCCTALAEESDVLELTDDTFEETIRHNPYVMVKFYAPWCGHCKAFAPEYEKAAKEAKEKQKPYILAKIDATVHKKAAEKEKVEGFPTVKFYANEKAIDYDGERTAEEVLAFLDKKTSPALTQVDAKEDLIKVKEGKGLRCILGTSTNSVLEIYKEVCLGQDDFICLHTTPKLLAEVFPEAKEDNVVVLKDFDEGMAIYSEPLDKMKLQLFLEDHSFPLVSELSQKVLQMTFAFGGKIGVFLFMDYKADTAKALEDEFSKAATEINSKDFLFIKADITGEWGSQLGEYFGIDASTIPVVEVSEVKEDLIHYRHSGELKASAIKQFVQDCKAGKVQQFFKSEEEPSEDKGPVYKLVGKNFKHKVMDNDDDVLVKFYAPWCGHCKELEPIYARLAEKLSGNKKLKLMEIDVTKNDVEGHPIEGLPTIKFFPGKNKDQPVAFEGERNEKTIADFIKKHASSPVELPEFETAPEPEKSKEDL